MKRRLLFSLLLLSLPIYAQDLDAPPEIEPAQPAATAAVPPTAQEPAVAPQAAPPSGSSGVVNLSDTIVGNQEQPTVLYIVPWKAADDTTILYLPLSSKAMEEIFGHVERVEHQRQVEFIEQLDSK